MLTKFKEKEPSEWQFIYVLADDDIDFVECGFYRNSEHHTYPYTICKERENPSSEIEGFTGEAQWWTA